MTHWPLDIVIASGGLPHDGTTLAQKSLGGSETAAIMVAKNLAARGHHVTMFTPCQGGFFDGVVYMPLEQFAGYASSVPHDVTVVSRIMDFLKLPLQSAVRILWCHDLALKRQRGFLYGVLWSVDAVYLLSPFMVRQYQEVYEGIPASIFYLTRNGIDLSAFAPLKFVARDRDKLVYGSRPERGLEQCLNIMDELARRHSSLRLEVACYDNVTPQMAPYYEALWARARTMPTVKLLGSLRQADWHRQIASALALIYPSCPGEFREISPVHGETIVETVQGPRRIKSLVGKSGFHVYSRRPDGRLGISQVRGVFQTRKNAKVIKLTMRPGSGRRANDETSLTLTPDHEVMLLDGTYRAAGDIRIGDHLMAMTRSRGQYPYDRIALTGHTQRDAHRIVIEAWLNRVLSPSEVIHHRDGDPRNNDPANLVVLSHAEHRRMHWREKAPERRQSEIARRTETLRVWLATPEGHESRKAGGLLAWAGKRRVVYAYTCHRCGARIERRARIRAGQKPHCSVRCVIQTAQEARWPVARNHVVIRIEDAPTADVYCMDVEPDHNFVAQGIVVHNCLVAMEAQACGTPMVTARKGAIPDTLAADAGVFLGDEDTDPNAEAYITQFADTLMALRDDEITTRRMAKAGLARAQELDWSQVARQWEAHWYELLAARVDDPRRVAAHFARIGEREAVA